MRQKARDYLWEQWRQKRLTYFLVADCLIYPEGCHDSVEYKIYVEPNEKGQWLIVIEPERVVSAWMGGTDKEERTTYTRSVYPGLKRLVAGEVGNCFSLVTERSEEPAQVPRLQLVSGKADTGYTAGVCFYF